MSPLSDNDLLAFTLILYKNECEKRKNRTMWVRPTYQLRPILGAHRHLLARIRISDPGMFKEHFRMTPQVFDRLLHFIEAKIAPSEASTRETISSAERLGITLKYLASGDLQKSISLFYLVSPSSISIFIRKVCAAIWDILMPLYLKPPSQSEWKEVADKINHRWQFPNCVGALDGKHVVIQAPPKSGSQYFNYKGSHSLVLLAVCDHNYKFLLVDIGAPGRSSDGGVFSASSFGQALDNGQLNLPPPSPIPSIAKPMPYVFVADEAFPLKTNIMRPFPGRQLPLEERIYNYRRSRARRLIENAFGILSFRFRIFRKPILAKVETIEGIIKAAVCLHNFLKCLDEELADDTARYCPVGFGDYLDPNGVMRDGAWKTPRT